MSCGRAASLAVLLHAMCAVKDATAATDHGGDGHGPSILSTLPTVGRSFNTVLLFLTTCSQQQQPTLMMPTVQALG